MRIRTKRLKQCNSHIKCIILLILIIFVQNITYYGFKKNNSFAKTVENNDNFR
jgi:hypothetical protein